jgi:hypothetical protein
VNLAGIIVELHDSAGKVVKSVPTGNGTPSYTINPSGSPWYVALAVDRKQVSSPSQYGPKTLPITAPLDFTVRGVPAKVRVTAAPGTFALVTPGNYLGATPPNVDQTSVTGPGTVISGTIGLTGSMDLNIPRGPTGQYYLTCWEATPCGQQTLYLRAPSPNSKSINNAISGGSPLTPQHDYTGAPITCDQASCPQ